MKAMDLQHWLDERDLSIKLALVRGVYQATIYGPDGEAMVTREGEKLGPAVNALLDAWDRYQCYEDRRYEEQKQ
jgi:hypothetical protein